MITVDFFSETAVFEAGKWKGVEYTREQVNEMVKKAKDKTYPLRTDFSGDLIGVVDHLRMVEDKVVGDVSIFDRRRVVQKEIAPKLTYVVTPINRKAEEIQVVEFGLITDSLNPRWRLNF